MSGTSSGGLCGLFGIRRVWDEGGVLAGDGLGFAGGAPGSGGNLAAAPQSDSLPDVVPRTLGAVEVPVQSRRNDPELLRGFRLRKGLFRFEELSQEPRRFTSDGCHGERFMNPNLRNVKNEDRIQEPERCKVGSMKVGRSTDEALAWYLHWRLQKMLSDGMNQKQIAAQAKIPRSALNHLLKNGRGVGSLTAAAFVEMFGFKSRGALIDAADAWFAKDGKLYALAQMRAQSREREQKTEQIAEQAAKSVEKARSRKKTA